MVSIATCIPSSACQVFVFPVRYMTVCCRVPISFRQSKINNVDLICFPAQTHQEVVWFDVSMQKPFGMNKFYSCDLRQFLHEVTALKPETLLLPLNKTMALYNSSNTAVYDHLISQH